MCFCFNANYIRSCNYFVYFIICPQNRLFLFCVVTLISGRALSDFSCWIKIPKQVREKSREPTTVLKQLSNMLCTRWHLVNDTNLYQIYQQTSQKIYVTCKTEVSITLMYDSFSKWTQDNNMINSAKKCKQWQCHLCCGKIHMCVHTPNNTFYLILAMSYIVGPGIATK